MITPSLEEDFEDLYMRSPSMFFEELKSEITYFQRTKVITLLDIYRIRKRLLPMLDVWISSQNKVYESVLNRYENLLLHALRVEPSLSDVTKMINDNKYGLRNVLKLLAATLPVNTNPLS